MVPSKISAAKIRVSRQLAVGQSAVHSNQSVVCGLQSVPLSSDYSVNSKVPAANCELPTEKHLQSIRLFGVSTVNCRLSFKLLHLHHLNPGIADAKDVKFIVIDDNAFFLVGNCFVVVDNKAG